MRRGSHSQGDEEPVLRNEIVNHVRRGNRAALSRKPSCAADLLILSPKCGKQPGVCVFGITRCGLVGR